MASSVAPTCRVTINALVSCKASRTEQDVRGRGPWPSRKSRPTSRTGRRFQSWGDRLFARKDRLEEQRRQQLEWIRQSISDIASREADVLTDTCNDGRHNGDNSDTDDEGFELEKDIVDDLSDDKKGAQQH